MTTQHMAVGRQGEQMAVEFLEARGYEIIDRNWYCAEGELDIVARDQDTLVFCEVKCRRGLRYGHPLETITSHKVRRLRRLVALWLRAHDTHAQHLRLDAIGVLLVAGQRPQVDHVEGIDQ